MKSLTHVYKYDNGMRKYAADDLKTAILEIFHGLELYNSMPSRYASLLNVVIYLLIILSSAVAIQVHGAKNGEIKSDLDA